MNTRRDIIRFVIFVFVITLTIALTFTSSTAENQVSSVQYAAGSGLASDEAANKADEDAAAMAEAQASADLERLFSPVIFIFVGIFVITLIAWLSRQQETSIYH